jgi:phosphohistidine swiveling domain-containing protein
VGDLNWQVFAQRRHAPLSARLLQEAQRSGFFEEATGIPGGLRSHAWIQSEIYIPEAELREVREAVASVMPADNWCFVEEFTSRCGGALARLEGAAEAIAADARLSTDPEALSERLEAWLDSYRGAMAFVPVFRIIDQVLSSYVSEDERAEMMRADPGRPTEEVRERSALRALAHRLARGGDRDAAGEEAAAGISAHVERYAWLGTRWHLGRPFDAEAVRRRVVALIATAGDEGPADPDVAAGPAIEGRGKAVRELAHLRNHRAEAVNRAIWIAAPLFESLGRRFGVSTADVPFFLPDELLSALRGSDLDRKLPEMRRTAFATVLFEDEFVAASGRRQVEEVRHRLDLPEPAGLSARDAGEAPVGSLLRGIVASPGRATGRVKLVRDGSDERKVEDGDILVTTMTYPSLVGSMQRSAAIVTDDGGLLSHAAVIARELEKPCLIGTERATEVLSDGDLVEVDCEAGVVNHAGAGAGRLERSRS